MKWKGTIEALSTHMRLLMGNHNFHHANLLDPAGCARLVNELVQLDRFFIFYLFPYFYLEYSILFESKRHSHYHKYQIFAHMII